MIGLICLHGDTSVSNRYINAFFQLKRIKANSNLGKKKLGYNRNSERNQISCAGFSYITFYSDCILVKSMQTSITEEYLAV